ncbi:TetR/AcrR family transcriptional regulator [Algoriphagus sp.]|uniref:TetR/AcrR family transcriptional regulator n=1 Tax=Algoriphagus sp. TaxID=1872435 RepID=UPI003270E920
MPSKIAGRLLESAQELFWKYGIKKTSIEEIAENAETSKMSFYRNFENKEDIAKKVLTKFMDHTFKKYTELMNLDIPFEQKMIKVMNLEHDESQNMSNEFIQEIIANENTELKSHFTALSDKYNAAFIRDLFKAQEDGYIRKDIKISFIMNMITMLNEQMTKESFTSMYSEPKDAIKELGQFFLYGIFPPRDQE